MKFFIRLFFKTLRIVLGPVMLLKESLTRPKGLVRAPAAQKKVDAQCQSLVLYQYKTCPFCIKVRQEISRLSLNIKRIDAQHEGPDRSDLLQHGGTVGSLLQRLFQRIRLALDAPDARQQLSLFLDRMWHAPISPLSSRVIFNLYWGIV